MRRLVCRYPFEPWNCSTCGELVEKRAPLSVVAGLVCDACLDRGRRGEPFIPLTVRMSAPKAERDERPILAVCVRDWTVICETGEVFELEQLPERLRERKAGESGRARLAPPEQLEPAIVVADQGLDLVAFLDGSELGDHPLWQWQVALTEQSAWRPEARARAHRSRRYLQAKPIRFGFASQRGGVRRATGRARWYQLIDVHQFVELPDGWGEPDAGELLRFGLELRDWCNRQQLPVGGSASAIGSRLLRDARFGGGWRRKMPAATNARARRMLVGNHYQLLTTRKAPVLEAHKFDMARAHHWAAFTTAFPHPDLLTARGRFRAGPGGSEFSRRGAIEVGTRRWREAIEQPGLFVIGVKVPERLAMDALELPQLRRPGHHWRVLSSVEIEHIRAREDGVKLLDIWCCWTSPETDDRLRELAWWASGQLDQAGAPRWLKPALLAPYGLLAARPREYRQAWKWCAKPAGAIGWQTRHGMIVGLERAGGREREPQTANVIWRALIESKVRLEALRMARELRGQRMTPLAIYADAIFATGERPDRLPPPWRYEGVIHDLEFESPARYISREETRLPGTPRSPRGPEDATRERESAFYKDQVRKARKEVTHGTATSAAAAPPTLGELAIKLERQWWEAAPRAQLTLE